MNIPALKAFAPAVRRQLIEAVTLQLNHALTARTPDYLDTYAPQVAALRKLEQEDRTGLIERVAYTWFNRLAALRFLDARGWHPFGARVLTAATPDETQPELLKLLRSGHCPAELQRHVPLDRINGLLDGRIPSNNPQGEVYRHLVLAACHFYHALLPNIFEKLDDETELLLPNDLLTEQSVAQGFRTEISDEDCSEVEILGWLYQFYISEKKEQVMARKSAVSTEDIPAVTQLFTPHWIVRYLVENSLGKLWLLNHPDSRLREQMPYYIEGDPETDFLRVSGPEEIKICDPAVGSGHMLTYAFELLYVIYEEQGYAPSEIPALILRNNLHGLDICPRAAQLAELALAFKAREKSSGFFRSGNLVRPHILALQNVHFAQDELRGYIEALRLGDLFEASMLQLLHQFEEAMTFGSLIQPCLEEQQIAFARGLIEVKEPGGNLFLSETHQKVLRVLEQAQMLRQRYHIVVENPPYCGSRYMNTAVSKLAKAAFKDGSGDMFAMFVLRTLDMAKPGGFLGVVCPFVWMFISTYKEFRRFLLRNVTFESMVRLEYNGFEPACIPVSTWVVTLKQNSERMSQFIDLSEFKGIENQGPKTLEAIKNPQVDWYFRTNCSEFLQIPTAPFAYLVSSRFIRTFTLPRKLEDLVEFTGSPNKTGDNGRFIRLWWEISSSGIGEVKRWVFYSKGGGNRKWWGLLEDVIDWSIGARSFYRENKTSNLLDSRFWFRPGITYSMLTSNQATFRRLPMGAVYDMGGPAFHPLKPEDELLLLALCNSRFADRAFDILNPTLNLQVSDVKSLPIPDMQDSIKIRITENTRWCEKAARADWDNWETSWGFQDHLLQRSGLRADSLNASWRNWEAQCAATISKTMELETENNRLFIEAYGLVGELTPEVPAEQITLARADARRDTAAFLSYAVGCMMGRYSLDHPGLILANAGESVPDYLDKVGLTRDQLTFAPDDDGIIPVLDGEWFEDDIVSRTREFLRATFGEATLRENIRFIEESLGRELRNYFLADFYRDHLQTYRKRPIYWMIQSPKKGFSVLIYLHRYTRDTMNLVLNRYLREFQVKLRSRISHLANVQASSATSTRDKTAARKEFDKLTKTLRECEEWERQVVLPLAQARIELDLDDGVKVNYLKLEEALATIPGLAAAED
jgi:Eco57I restriction-modification methylase